MIKKIFCFLNKKGHKISTHNRKCMKCGKYFPPREKSLYVERGFKL